MLKKLLSLQTDQEGLSKLKLSGLTGLKGFLDEKLMDELAVRSSTKLTVFELSNMQALQLEMRLKLLTWSANLFRSCSNRTMLQSLNLSACFISDMYTENAEFDEGVGGTLLENLHAQVYLKELNLGKNPLLFQDDARF